MHAHSAMNLKISRAHVCVEATSARAGSHRAVKSSYGQTRQTILRKEMVDVIVATSLEFSNSSSPDATLLAAAFSERLHHCEVARAVTETSSVGSFDCHWTLLPAGVGQFLRMFSPSDIFPFVQLLRRYKHVNSIHNLTLILIHNQKFILGRAFSDVPFLPFLFSFFSPQSGPSNLAERFGEP